MRYRVIGNHNIGFHAPGSVLSESQVAAAGGSVSHLIASGHLAVVSEPAAKARKAASVKLADEAETVEEQ